MNPKTRNVEDIYELTPLQQELSAAGLGKVRQAVYRLGPLDETVFRRAWNTVMERHQVLRTSFHTEGLSKPVQVVHRIGAQMPPSLDWSQLPPTQQEERLNAFVRQDCELLFTPSAPPLQRWSLMQLGAGSYFFVWSYDPLILDRESALLVFQEVLVAYRCLVQGTALTLPPARRFRDYMVQVREQGLAAAEEFWRRNLRGFVVPTALPEEATDSSDAPVEEESLTIPPPLLARMRRSSKTHDETIGTMLDAAWALLLYTYDRRRDIVFGLSAPHDAPRSSGGGILAGPLRNRVPIRVQVEAEETLGPWLKRVHARRAEAQAYDYLPPGRIRACAEAPLGGRLFNALLVREPQPMSGPRDELSSGGLEAEAIRAAPPMSADCPLILRATRAATGLELRLQHDGGRLRPGGGTRILERFRAILARLASARPDTKLDHLAPIELICLRAGGERPAFFCVHPAGGSSLGYAPLANRLGPMQPFYAFEASNAADRQRLHRSIETLAEHYVGELCLAQPSGPCFLGGWSSGGLVAYAMARKLVARGRDVALLALFDTAVPETQGDSKLLPVRQVLGRLAVQMGLNLENRNDLRSTPVNELPALLIAEARRASLLPPSFGEAELRRLVRLYRIHVAAAQEYVPQPYSGRVTLFRAGEGKLPSHLGWERLAAAVELHSVPGNHHTLLREPNVQELAAQLTNCLTQAATGSAMIKGK